jgi:predicted small lipoprotein YifL
MARRFVTVVVGCGVLAGLGACGQKGPLYLPDKGGEVVTRPGGGQASQQQSPETAPQPSTQPQPSNTEREKKTQPPR